MSKPDRKPSLLIVDDEINFRESLEIALEDTFNVSTAGTLARAREALVHNVPDTILLDSVRPETSFLST